MAASNRNMAPLALAIAFLPPVWLLNVVLLFAPQHPVLVTYVSSSSDFGRHDFSFLTPQAEWFTSRYTHFHNFDDPPEQWLMRNHAYAGRDLMGRRI